MTFDCAVIGAGHAGLAASWHLARHGIEHVVFEQGHVGETWRTQRWDSFQLNSPGWANALPGDALPVEPPDGFLGRDAWIDRLAEYAVVQRLPVREATRIAGLESGDAQRPFRLRTDGGEEIGALTVVVAAYDQTVEQLADPRARFAALPMISGVGRYGHTLSLQLLADRGAVLLGRLRAIEDGCVTFSDDLRASISLGDQSSAQFRAQIEGTILARHLDAPDPDPDPADDPFSDLESLDSPSEIDLDAEDIRTVIWATGVRADLSWIKVPVTDSSGALPCDGGRTPVPGLWLTGMPWLRTRKSGIIMGAADDAGAVVDQVAAHLASHA